MRNRDIIKKSLLFPIKKYKHFIVVSVLFLFLELSQEFLLYQTYDQYTIYMAFFVHFILPLFIVGFNLQIIFHIIHQNRGLPKLSIKTSVKEAIKDKIIDSYYFGLTLLITAILSIPTGIYHNIYDVYFHLTELMVEVEDVTVIEIMGALPEVLLENYLSSITISTIIFLVTFIILFSLCSISKIDFEVNQVYKQTFNTKRMIKIIKKIGIIKYLGFLFLTIVLSIILANIIYHLEFAPIVGSILSAGLEAFSLFFFIYSFALLYPEDFLPT